MSLVVIDPEAIASDQRAFFELQETVRRNKQTLVSLRREKKDIGSALTFLETEGSTSAAYQQTELEKTGRKIAQLRRRHDELRADLELKRREVTRLDERLTDHVKESQPLMKEDSPLALKIRMLENRLDKSMIKYNEAMAIRHTYEAIVKRLKKERVGFDNQLAAIERTLKAKDHDFQELLNMSHDANHAKEAQKQQLAKFRALFEEQRTQKKVDLIDRRAYVDACIERTERLQKKERTMRKQDADAAARPGGEGMSTTKVATTAVTGRPEQGAAEADQEAARIAEYEEALRRVKEVTGAVDADDVIAKFAAQEETHRSLEAMVRDATARIEAVNAERAEHQKNLEELKYSGNGQHGSRRIVDECAARLSESEHLCAMQRAAYERVARMLIHVKAGVEHLQDKLAALKTDLPVIPLTDETVLDVLKQCEVKLQLVVEELSQHHAEDGAAIPAGETAAQYLDRLAAAAASGQVLLPAHNQRVRLTLAEPDELDRDDDGDEDEDVLDRATIKKMAALAVQRETRKQKRRRPGAKS